MLRDVIFMMEGKMVYFKIVFIMFIRSKLCLHCLRLHTIVM